MKRDLATSTAIASAPRIGSVARRTLRIVPARWHGILDYGAAAALLGAPFALGLSAGPRALSVAAGGLLVAYSLLTDYALSLAKVFAVRTHLAFDLTAGVVLLAAPFVFGFDGIARAYFAVMGLGVFGAVAATNPDAE